jgi:hypothetical protein
MLPSAASQWRTPSAGHPSKGGGQAPEKRLAGGHTLDLQDQVTTWPTPSARDHKSGNASQETLEKNAQPLNEMAQQWATPTKCPQGGRFHYATEGKGGMDIKSQAEAFSHPDPATQKPGANCWCGNHGCDLRSHKRRLNPLFVTLLMGWPAWWCATEPMPSAPAEMASYLSRVRSRLQFFLRGDYDSA